MQKHDGTARLWDGQGRQGKGGTLPECETGVRSSAAAPVGGEPRWRFVRCRLGLEKKLSGARSVAECRQNPRGLGDGGFGASGQHRPASGTREGEAGGVGAQREVGGGGRMLARVQWGCVQGARPAGVPANPDWMHGMDGMGEERDGGSPVAVGATYPEMEQQQGEQTHMTDSREQGNNH